MAHFDSTPLRCVGSMTARRRLFGLKSSMAHFDETPLRRNSEVDDFPDEDVGAGSF
jgi:hypothetical protein